MDVYTVVMLGLAVVFVANMWMASATMDRLAERNAPMSDDEWDTSYAHLLMCAVAAVAMLVVYVLDRW